MFKASKHSNYNFCHMCSRSSRIQSNHTCITICTVPQLKKKIELTVLKYIKIPEAQSLYAVCSINVK